jgi:hypothetical protein
MDYAAFHQNLLGILPEKTPREFRITPAQERLYTASKESTKHGYLLVSSWDSRESWEHFLATFILAYAQTPTGEVAFAVSGSTQKWAGEQLKKIARHIFSTRAKASRASIQELYGYFQRLMMGSNILQLDEPTRWVAYGFNDADILPPWMRGHLLSAGPA